MTTRYQSWLEIILWSTFYFCTFKPIKCWWKKNRAFVWNFLVLCIKFFQDLPEICFICLRVDSELRKDYFCPVSLFSNKKCPNHVYDEICHMIWGIKVNIGLFSVHLWAFGVELYHRWTLFYPVLIKYAKINSNYLKMTGFSSRNVRYPRYQNTDLLQRWVD